MDAIALIFFAYISIIWDKKWRWRHVTSRCHIKSDFHKIFRNHLDSYNYDTVKIWSQLYKIYRNYYNFSFCQFVLKCIGKLTDLWQKVYISKNIHQNPLKFSQNLPNEIWFTYLEGFFTRPSFSASNFTIFEAWGKISPPPYSNWVNIWNMRKSSFFAEKSILSLLEGFSI